MTHVSNFSPVSRIFRKAFFAHGAIYEYSQILSSAAQAHELLDGFLLDLHLSFLRDTALIQPRWFSSSDLPIPSRDSLTVPLIEISKSYPTVESVFDLALMVGSEAIFGQAHKANSALSRKVSFALEAFLVRAHEALQSFALLHRQNLGDASVALGSAIEALAKFHKTSSDPEWLQYYRYQSLKKLRNARTKYLNDVSQISYATSDVVRLSAEIDRTTKNMERLRVAYGLDFSINKDRGNESVLSLIGINKAEQRAFSSAGAIFAPFMIERNAQTHATPLIFKDHAAIVDGILKPIRAQELPNKDVNFMVAFVLGQYFRALRRLREGVCEQYDFWFTTLITQASHSTTRS